MADFETNRLQSITPDQLRREVLDADEIAVVDVWEGDRYASGHISVAVGLPLSEIELRAALLCRGSVRIVVTDDNGASLAPAAATRLQALEYRNVRVLEGDLQAWKVEGNELITGLNSLSKALGEFVERRYHTPSIMAGELRDLIASGEDIVVLDTRPLEEFNHISIPCSIAAPGRGTVMSRVRRGAVTGHPSRRQLRRAYPSHYWRAGVAERWCPHPGRIAAERNRRLAAGGIGTGSWRHHAGNHTLRAGSGQGSGASARVAARFGVRAIDRTLLGRLDRVPGTGPIVLTSSDGALARLAATELVWRTRTARAGSGRRDSRFDRIGPRRAQTGTGSGGPGSIRGIASATYAGRTPHDPGGLPAMGRRDRRATRP